MTDDDVSELRDLIPRVLQALHVNKLWGSVKSAEEISCAKVEDYPKPNVGILTSANPEESPVVVKFESKISQGNKLYKIGPCLVEIHQLLSDHGLGTKLLAFSMTDEDSLPNFTVETVGVGYFNIAAAAADENYWATANSETATGGVMAKLAARLHKKVQVQWFDKYRKEICELCPLMKDEPDNSPLWVMVSRTDALDEARSAAAKAGKGGGGDQVPKQQKQTFLNQKRAHAPSDEDIKRLLTLLPKPCGEHASRAVTCHGDLWAANVVLDKTSNQAVLIDLEGVTVSYAATDLAQFPDRRGVSKVYLEELMEGTEAVPTEEDIDKFWFEVLIASHVQTGILRSICWTQCGGDWTETSVPKMIAHAERFSAYVEKLRTDWELALQILRKSSEGSDMDAWISDELMDSVLGHSD